MYDASDQISYFYMSVQIWMLFVFLSAHEETEVCIPPHLPGHSSVTGAGSGQWKESYSLTFAVYNFIGVRKGGGGVVVIIRRDDFKGECRDGFRAICFSWSIFGNNFFCFSYIFFITSRPDIFSRVGRLNNSFLL